MPRGVFRRFEPATGLPPAPVACTVYASPFDECGGIRTWNILGAYDSPWGEDPVDDLIKLDYMTDGEVGELDFPWAPGATIETDFGGAAASIPEP